MDASFHRPEALDELRDVRVHLHMLRTHPEGIFNFDGDEARSKLGTQLQDQIITLEESLVPMSGFVRRALVHQAQARDN